MSATHRWFGASAEKSRSSRSSATLTPGTRTVVALYFLVINPDKPAWRMRRSTRLRPIRSPSSQTRSAQIRGEP